ncbi:hypothetical protein [Halomonas halodenitrificans]|uniref:hypothetical protein n=1 Tax=Halomonas halodenitrificans TaxID=28252 RepID=UPI000486579D|nr:hypothetical protein [Halomonas halodenitrificans]
MSEPTELPPNHKSMEPPHRDKRGAGKGSRKGSRKALYGLLAVSLAGAVVSGALLLRAAPDEVPVESLVQSQVQRAVVPLEEVLARVESQQATLEQRLTDLGQRLEQAEQRVKESAANQAQLKQIEPRFAGLAEELSRLDSELNLRVTAQNEQIQTLSERLEQSQRQQAEPRPTPARKMPRSAAPPSPPFQVTGVESRGGRLYVGVSPNGLSSLLDIRLLGIGDRQGGWELTRIRGSHAVFNRNGRAVDVQIP